MKRVKATCIFTFALLAAFNHVFGQTEADKIIGLYWSPQKDARIEIYKKGSSYFGKTVWAAIPRKDSQNPNQQLRQRNLLGLDILTNFTYEDGQYKDGKVYDPGNGKTYSCKMTLDGANLKVKGYIGISLLGRTELFERIQ